MVNRKIIQYGSLCSGVEAASLAWGPLGWKPVFFSEIEPFPCAVLRDRFPEVPNLGDMTKINGKEYHGKIDLLVGGTPCQDLSVAGKRLGFGGTRSVLALDFIRLAYESGARWVVWENVPGALSAREGRDFSAFLSGLSGCEIAVPDGGGFATAGIVRPCRRDRFGMAWRVLDAEYVRVDGFPRAVPQRRRRVFVVGHLGDWTRAAEVLFESDSLLGHTPPVRTAGQAIAAGAGAGAEAADPESGVNGCPPCMAQGQANAEIGCNQSPTLTCRHEAPILCAAIRMREGRHGQGGRGPLIQDNLSGTLATGNDQTICIQENVRSEVRKVGGEGKVAACLQAQPGMKQQNYLCTTQYGEVAGTLEARFDSSACADRGQNVLAFSGGQGDKARSLGIGHGVAPSIRASSGGNSVPDLLCYDARGNGNGKICPCLTGDHAGRVTNLTPLITIDMMASKGNCNVSRENVSPTLSTTHNDCHAVFPINSMVIGKELKGEDRQTAGIGGDGDPCPTLGTSQHHAAAIAENIIGRKAENGGNDIGAQQEVSYTLDAIAPPGVSFKSSVRRLTPLECERLMGFPDNWTRIPWRGKSAEDCPDAPRYKACGNSMCVNCMRWIGERIQAAEDSEG